MNDTSRTEEGYSTPPHQTIHISDEPPPMTGGRIFRKFSSDEEESTDDSDSGNVSGVEKIDNDDKLRRRGDVGGLVRTNSIRKRAGNNRDIVEQPLMKIAKKIEEIKTDLTEQVEEGLNQYSELNYIESIGVIRMAAMEHGKYRGRLNRSRNIETSPSSPSSSSSNNEVTAYRERATRIRISYRLRNDDLEQIQFVLIIYEYDNNGTCTSVVSRRNLMNEFKEIKRKSTTPMKTPMKTPKKTMTTETTTTPTKITPTTPKTLRF